MLKGYKECASYFFMTRLARAYNAHALEWYYNDGYDCDFSIYNEIAEEMGARWCNAGVSKVVFYFDEFPEIVFKIPFIGVRLLNEDGDYFNCKYYSEANSIDSSFAEFSDSDYCAIEAELFNLADYYGVGSIFAKTEYAGEYKQIPFYISEKIESPNFYDYDYNYYRHASVETKKTAQNILRDSDCEDYNFNVTYLALIIDQYGKAMAEEFMYFITVFKVQDLHCGNVGWDSNNNFRIFDYSGFRDEIDEYPYC